MSIVHSRVVEQKLYQRIHLQRRSKGSPHGYATTRHISHQIRRVREGSHYHILALLLARIYKHGGWLWVLVLVVGRINFEQHQAFILLF